MTVYLDASVLVSMFVMDAHSSRIAAYLAAGPPQLAVSDWAAAEFASAVARLARMNRISADSAGIAFGNFDHFVARTAQRIESTPADIRASLVLLRRLDVNHSTPDVMNLAIVQRLRISLLSFDERLVATAARLGIEIAAA